MSSSVLADHLSLRHGMTVEVIRLMMVGEQPAAGRPVVMDLNPLWRMSGLMASQRANRCDVALLRFDRHFPPQLVDEFLSDLAVPVILSVEDVGPEEPPETSLLGEWAGRVDIVVVPSQMARRRLEARTGTSANIEVIPQGSPWRAIALRTGPRRRILSWGFLAPGMGAERIIGALTRLEDLKPLPRFRLVGVADPTLSPGDAASYRTSLTRQAKQLGVLDQIEMVPLHQRPQDLADDMAQSDLVAVVYDSKTRSASRLLNEAVSTGRPVVATAFPGAVEMLSSGAGTTVGHNDEQGLADALRLYMTDEAEYLRAAAAASRLSPKLSCEEVARQFSQLVVGLDRKPELIAKRSL
ncbi:MAG TPA: glycosyltransferase [Acidimicrobiia bacterium]|nr:glycosyltransferase [Acidimicrobiia bacterium]